MDKDYFYQAWEDTIAAWVSRLKTGSNLRINPHLAKPFGDLGAQPLGRPMFLPLQRGAVLLVQHELKLQSSSWLYPIFLTGSLCLGLVFE